MSPEAALAEAALAEIAPTPYEGTGAARVIALEPGEAEGRAKAIAATYSRPELGGICVVDGFACSVRVERGAPQVSDGVGEHRRIRRYDKATRGLSRIVVANAAGTLSLEALAFCERLGIGVLVLGGDGRVQLASNPRMTDDARLRRAQGLAPARGYGLDIAKLLLEAARRYW